MTSSPEAARTLLAYDPRIAEHVLRLVARELGIEEKELDRLQAGLTNLRDPDDGDAKSTREWKLDFGLSERLRSLALALAESLEQAERRDP